MTRTSKERFIHALERREPIKGEMVPHFELVFFLTMEAFGRVHPSQRHYGQWEQMTEKERQLHREDMADIYLLTCERFHEDGILMHPPTWNIDEIARQAETLQKKNNGKYFVLLHGDCTFSMPNGNNMVDFAAHMLEEPEMLEERAKHDVENAIHRAEKLKGLVDGFALCSDYAMNNAPFFSPEQFARFIAPYLKTVISCYREMGYYTIKHTDGCLWPILDQIADSNPHALHSIDPQGQMDLRKVKELYGDRLCLIGNVSCAALDTGTDEEVIQSAREALQAGMPDGGYIFGTSNCIYTGMRLERYELMLRVWEKEGRY